MTTTFIDSFQSEWLKRKGSLASWLVLGGALFIPTIMLAVRLKNAAKLPDFYVSNDFWTALWKQSWEPMATFFLPMGVILATALITQLEYKNNGWKQLHTTPQRLGTIFFTKLLVILVLMIGLLVLFNVGIYLSVVIPSLLLSNVPYPTSPIPWRFVLGGNLNFLIDCLPILALQYLLSLQFRSFLVPIGVGFAVLMLGLGFVTWEHSYIFPYIYSSLDHFITSGHLANRVPGNLQLLAVSYFVVFTVVSYILYVTKKDKG